MICPNCQHINEAAALFCQNCGTQLQVRCPNCGTANGMDARFCKNCGHALTDAPSPTADNQPGYINAMFQSHPVPKHSERRVVTIMFVDVKGSTALAEKLDPEEWTGIMNLTFDRMTRAVTRYDGTVARLMGDAILAFFGAPNAHEDDPYRAILAGLDMLDELRPFQSEIRAQMARRGHNPADTDFEIRVGINTGLVVVGEVGTRPYVEYTAMGDAVNVAARLEQTAAPGTIQVSHDTYRLVSHRVEANPLGTIQVKGKKEALKTYQVIRKKEQPRNLRGISNLEAPLIGRTAELSRLKAVIAQLHRGYGQVVSLIGEAGLGKSRLVAEMRAAPWMQETEWIEAVSLSFETSQPYGLVKRLLQRVLGLTNDDSTAAIQQKIKAVLDHIPPEDQEIVQGALETLFILHSENDAGSRQGEALQRELYEGIRVFWKHHIGGKPTLLVLDDLHWADLASVDLILHLVELIEEIPVVFLYIFRPERQSPAWRAKQHAESRFPHRYEEISLHPLNSSESNALVKHLLENSDLSAPIFSLILEKTEGNPFFVEEIVHELVDKGCLVYQKEAHSWKINKEMDEIDIPDSLETLLISRLDRLETGTRHTAQLAAVIGRSFYYRVLKLIADRVEKLDQDLKVLQQSGLILEAARQPELEYMFRHVLTQEAAYNTILLSQRRQFHQQAGEVMERLFADRLEEYAPLLAHHFLRSGDQRRAFRYFTMAAKSAAGLFANLEAVLHFNEALALVSVLADTPAEMRIQLLRGRGLALEAQGKFTEALDDLEHALRLAQENDLRETAWRCLLDLGLLWASRDYTQSGEIYHQALEIARGLGNPAAVGDSLNRLGNWYINRDNPREALRYHQEALAIFEAQQNDPGIADTLDLLGMTTLLGADPVSSAGYYRDAITLFRKLDNRPGLVSSLTGAKYRGPNYQSKTVYPADTLQAMLDEGMPEIELARRINWKAGESWASWAVSLGYGAHGMYQEAFAFAQAGYQIAVDIQHRQWMAGGKTALGSIYFDILHYEEAINHLEEARALGIEVDSINWIKTASGYLVLVNVHAGKLQKAQAVLDAIMEPQMPMETIGQRNAWWGLAALQIAQGNPQTGLEVAEQLIATAPSRPPDGVITQLWKVKAEALIALGRVDAGEKVLWAAIENGQEQGEYPLVWRLYAALGNIHQARGRIPDAVQAFTQAQRIIDRLAATLPDKNMETAFRTRAQAFITSAGNPL